jgi:hypothetical protein
MVWIQNVCGPFQKYLVSLKSNSCWKMDGKFLFFSPRRRKAVGFSRSVCSILFNALIPLGNLLI